MPAGSRKGLITTDFRKTNVRVSTCPSLPPLPPSLLLSDSLLLLDALLGVRERWEHDLVIVDNHGWRLMRSLQVRILQLVRITTTSLTAPAFISCPVRAYTPAPAYLEEHDDDLSTSTRSFRPTRPSQAPSTTTPESAQAYLTDLLHLPPSRAFPPALALQILTHKSYRFVNLIRHGPSSSTPTAGDEWAANHNARLTFLGRRALASYLALFVHSSIMSCAELRGMDFLRGRSLENKLEAMRVEVNLGREVGTPWGVYDVMRWDRNGVSLRTRLSNLVSRSTIPWPSGLPFFVSSLCWIWVMGTIH